MGSIRREGYLVLFCQPPPLAPVRVPTVYSCKRPRTCHYEWPFEVWLPQTHQGPEMLCELIWQIRSSSLLPSLLPWRRYDEMFVSSCFPPLRCMKALRILLANVSYRLLLGYSPFSHVNSCYLRGSLGGPESFVVLNFSPNASAALEASFSAVTAASAGAPPLGPSFSDPLSLWSLP